MKHGHTLSAAAVGLAAALLLVTAGRGDAESSSACVWVLDSGERTLVSLALPAGERLAELKLEGEPESLIQTPDGSRLIVLDRGPGKDEGERGYAAKGKSTATIVEAASLEVVARVRLGAGVDGRRYYFSADGRRLTLLCPGLEDKNPEKSLPREVVNLDVVAGVELGRVSLEHGTIPIGFDGARLVLMRGLNPGSVVPFGKGRFWVVHLSDLAVTGPVATGGWFDLNADGPYVYLLHKGYPHPKPQFNRNGSMLVYSTEGLEATLDVGRDPRSLYRDAQGRQLFIPSDSPVGSEKEAAGRLYVVRGARIAATLEVAANPRFVQRRGEVVFVVGEAAVSLIDPVALQVTTTIPLRDEEGTLVDDDDVPTELELTPDGKRALILYGLHNRVAVVDLEKRTAVGSIKTGRQHKELLSGLSSGLRAASVLLPGWWGAGLEGAGSAIGVWDSYLDGSLWPSLLSHRLDPAAFTPSMLAVHPDGHVAYALNSQGTAVTLVDAATAGRAEQLRVRGRLLGLLPGGHVLAVVSPTEIHLIGTAALSKLNDLDVKELRAFRTTPDGVLAVALGKGVVLCIDGASGEVLARLTDFDNPVMLAFSGSGHDTPGDDVPSQGTAAATPRAPIRSRETGSRSTSSPRRR